MKVTLEGKDSIVGITDDANTVRISLISEPRMYKLVFKSRKPEAEKFSDWVVSEVLPTIRKTGSYGTTKSFKSSGGGDLV
ncbi:MAG: BRO family protein [Candidatus Gracilibacteria bacterium]|nr:BRO family protein [Candidatus Gracilibacteria bacterium]